MCVTVNAMTTEECNKCNTAFPEDNIDCSVLNKPNLYYYYENGGTCYRLKENQFYNGELRCLNPALQIINTECKCSDGSSG